MGANVMSIPIIRKTDWSRLQNEAARRVKPNSPLIYSGCLPYPQKLSLPSCISGWPSDLPTIPRDEWPDLISLGKGTFLSDLRRDILRPHDQNGRNRCWAHGSVRAVELLRLWQGQPPVLLSPDSVAWPIEGTKDRGGYPVEACHQLAIFGACSQNLWPENDLSPRDADPSWQKDALKNRILRWFMPTTWEQQITCAIKRIPVPIGLGWWGHLVCQLDPVLLSNREVGILIDNSWGADWGDNGSAILDEESGTADLGAFAPFTKIWSND